MTTTIQAIDTLYRGHYFRSRLEARWAVVFDVLKIAWRYEPEAYRVGPEQVPYLPDFYLPDLGTWVEVKGSETDFLAKADVYGAACHPESGLPGMAESVLTTRGFLILGPIPEGRPNARRPMHTLIQHGLFWNRTTGLDMEGTWRCWAAFTEDSRIAVTAIDSTSGTPEGLPPAGQQTPLYTQESIAPGLPFGPDKVAAAYAIARAVRFDQGKKGLVDSINAAVDRFKEDLETNERTPDTDKIWERCGDLEIPQEPGRVQSGVRTPVLSLRELRARSAALKAEVAEHRRAAGAQR